MTIHYEIFHKISYCDITPEWHFCRGKQFHGRIFNDMSAQNCHKLNYSNCIITISLHEFALVAKFIIIIISLQFSLKMTPYNERSLKLQ